MKDDNVVGNALNLAMPKGQLTKLKSLEEKRNLLDKTIATERNALKATLRRAIEDAVASVGLTIDDLMSPRRVGAKIKTFPRSRRLLKARYRDPAAPHNMWSGRGRHPRWLAEKLESGASLSDFEIKK